MANNKLSAPADATNGLAGLRVVELGHGFAAECAGLMLATYGADVVKIQRPDAVLPKHSGYRLWNSIKTVREIDVATSKGSDKLRSLLKAADAFIVAVRPSTRQALRVDYEDVRSLNPSLVYAEIDGFGPGRYEDLPGWEGLVSVKTGRGSIYEGQVDRQGPVFPAVPVGSYGAAHGAVQGILSALWQRERTRKGRKIQTSLTRALATFDIYNWLELQFPNVVSQWVSHDEKSRKFRLAVLPFTVAATKDGKWIQFANNADHLFYRLMTCLGQEDVYLTDGFETLPNVTAERQLEVRRLIIETVREKTFAEWEAIFDADGTLGYELIRSIEEVEFHPQVMHNQQLPKNKEGKFTLAPPWRVRAAAQTDRDTLDGSSSPGGPKLLDGIKVLELGGYLAGPFAGRLMAELGARVIKIEPPAGDPMRAMRGGLGPAHPNIGKESIALNLKKPFGRDALERLIKHVDILYHNYRPGIAESLGFGAERALELNPRLVYVYAASYGSSGPMVTRASYDVIPSSVSGCASRQSGGCLPPSPEETMQLDIEELAEISRRLGLCTADMGDQSAAIQVATAMIYGLFAGSRTGRGCSLETTTLGAAIYANSEAFDDHLEKDRQLACGGLGISSLYRLYECREGWVFLAAIDDKSWEALKKHVVPSVPDLRLDQAWSSGEVSSAIESAFSQLTADDVESLCIASHVPCVSALPSRGALLQEEWVSSSGMVADTEDKLLGHYRRFTGLVRDGTEPSARGVPRLGEQTVSILSEVGFGEDEIEAAHEDRVVIFDKPDEESR